LVWTKKTPVAPRFEAGKGNSATMISARFAKDADWLLLKQKQVGKIKGKNNLLKDRISVLTRSKFGMVIHCVDKGGNRPAGYRYGNQVSDRLEDRRLSGRIRRSKKTKLNLIRHAYTLPGTEWDILLIVSATSQDEFAEFLSKTGKQGWVAETWSFHPGRIWR